jgi:PKD repeat protein
MNITARKISSMLLSGVLAIGTYTACQPDEAGSGNGLDSPDLTASFTVTPAAGKNNKYLLEADPIGVLGVRWDKGDGAGPVAGKTIDTVFYPDAGTYRVELTAIGKGGSTAKSSKDIVVATSDPVAGNLVAGAKMEAGDESYWTPFTISGTSVSFAFGDGKLTASGGGNNGHAGIYQAIEVIGGKKYRLDLNVSGAGATDVWFEVYLGKVEPTEGQDYTNGGNYMGLNTWDGCGKTAFNGKLSTLACSGSLKGKPNVVQFDESGTIYLVIKTGGANLGTGGISIDNVELRGTN